MSETTRAILSSWVIAPWPTVCALAVIAVYLRGWIGLRRLMPERFTPWRAASFIAGITLCWCAIASPLDALAGMLLQIHMTQHVLLMMVGPPLILLGYPGIPMLRGLPATVRREWLGPLLASRSVRRWMHRITHPVTGLTLLVLATWTWHVPVLYELALRDPVWHEIEHAVFLSAAILFWWPVIQPWPTKPVWPVGGVVLYLLAADVQNTLFSAIFVFLETPIYGAYAAAPRLFGTTVLDDQAVAGAIMWVTGSAAFLIPAGVLLKRMLTPSLVRAPRMAIAGAVHTPPTTVSLQQFVGGAAPRHASRTSDLLQRRGLGTMLRSLRVRRCVQWIMFGLAAAIVIDGLLGPRLSPMNLAGVLPWTHWRGFVVIALLLAGNAFCWACPFMLPRELGKRLFNPTRQWPRRFRSKWLAVALLLLYLWIYEAWSLWDSPWWTAWIVIGYFVGAFVIDAFFRGAAFCRWVCPIGQFHFVESMASPREVARLDADTCRTCTTHDCIRGGPGGRGCELDLYLPTKRGNLDCTWCMDCVRACPHENVGVVARPMLEDVVHPGWRGGISRLGRRPDLAALAALLTFGAFANALGMVGPVLALEDALQARWSLETPLIPATLVLLIVAAFVPAIVLPIFATAGAWVARTRARHGDVVCRLAFALVPMGFAMWLVHMLFHFFTALGTIVPVTQRAIMDLGGHMGEPAWALACCLSVPDWLIRVELLLLDAGLIATVIALHRVARDVASTPLRALWTTLVWSMLALALMALGAWIMLEPMQMRGTLLP